MSDQITNLPLSAIEEDPDNSRTTYNPAKLQELADSIKGQGIMSPLVARPLYPNGDAPTHVSVRYRLVFGHRRLRAAVLAGLEWVPVIVREMSAEDAATAQLIENAQRDDVPALDEARAFERMKREFSTTVAQLIERTGMSRSYIYGRLNLLKLADAPRNALLAGQIDAEVAGLISRLPGSVQEEALDQVTLSGPDGAYSMSYRDAKKALKHLIVDLAEAPFPVEVVGMAGMPACTACAYRAGNDPAMSDMAPMSCARRACYTSKLGVWVQQQIDEAKAAGRRVIEGDEALHVYAYGITWRLRGWEDADEPRHVMPGDLKTPRELLAATGREVTTALLVLPPKGDAPPRLLDVIDHETLAAAARDYIASKTPAGQDDGDDEGRMGEGGGAEDDEDDDSPQYGVPRNKYEAATAGLTAAERAVTDATHWQKVLDAIASRVRHTARTAGDLRLLVRSSIEMGADFDERFITLAFGWQNRFANTDRVDLRTASLALIDTLPPADLAAILVLWALADMRTACWRDWESPEAARALAMRRLALAHAYGVDEFDPEQLVPPADDVQTPEQVGDLFDAAAAPADTPSTAARATKGAKAAPRYRCPLTGSTWSGRGLQPAWLRAALANGKTLAEFDTTKPKEQMDEAGSAGRSAGEVVA